MPFLTNLLQLESDLTHPGVFEDSTRFCVTWIYNYQKTWKRPVENKNNKLRAFYRSKNSKVPECKNEEAV